MQNPPKIHPTALTVFSHRVGFINAIIFAIALISRALFFAWDVQTRHSANVIGWPFAFDMFELALVGTIIGIFISVISKSRAALIVNCLLLPLTFFLVFIVPHYFLHNINFD